MDPYPPEVGRSLGVRGLGDEFIDPLKVVRHRLARVDARHLDRFTSPGQVKGTRIKYTLARLFQGPEGL